MWQSDSNLQILGRETIWATIYKCELEVVPCEFPCSFLFSVFFSSFIAYDTSNKTYLNRSLSAEKEYFC